MKSVIPAIAFALLFSIFCAAQSRDSATNADAAAQAQRLLAKTRAALGGDANLQSVRSLSLTGKYLRRSHSGQAKGEIKIELLTPDKFLKTEESNPGPTLFVTTLQAVNGNQIWFDRRVNRPAGDDGSAEFVKAQPGRTSPIATESSGMRGTTAGVTTVRTNPPGTNTTERSVLGMPLPAPQGRGSDTDTSKIEAARNAVRKPVPGARPPGIENPGVQSLLKERLRNEAVCLMFTLLLTPPSSFPLTFAHAGEIQTPHGKVEAIEISGPGEFAGRLFIDQASSRPAMLSYRELVNQKAGYVVTAGAESRQETRPEDVQEIAVQLYFADYRSVNGVMLPFQIIKAVNGAPIDEWKIEKYKVNPDLKPKKFEKK
jgi:hypothetical protein